MTAPSKALSSGQCRVASTCAKTKGSVSGIVPSVKLEERLPLTHQTPAQGPRKNSVNINSWDNLRKTRYW